MNERYVQYARVHGRTPDAQLAWDAGAWPGGQMCGFLLWHRRRVAEWIAKHGSAASRYFKTVVDVDMPAYDAWLAALPVGYDAEERSR